MERRLPSSLLPLSNHSAIRRRSGGYSPYLDVDTLNAPFHGQRAVSDGHLGQHRSLAQDASVLRSLSSEPRVLLATSCRASPNLAVTPELCERELGGSVEDGSSVDIVAGSVEDDLDDGRLQDEKLHFATLSDPPPESSSPGSVPSANAPDLHSPELPTPNFSQGGTDMPLPYYAACEPEAPLSTIIESPEEPTMSLQRPVVAQRNTSAYTVTSNALRRPVLLPSFSTTDKFTHKFPRLRTLRNLRSAPQRTRQRAAFASTMLEEGEGLGLDRIDRWTIHKWCLILSVSTIFVYGIAGLVFSVLTWFQTWPQADVMNVADIDILVLITLASSMLLLTFLVGLSGTILNSRPLLAVYALLLWPAGLAIVVIGYVAYKRSTFALDRKLNLAWSEWYTLPDRLVIQDSLRCCGFYDALHDAAPSKQCYARTPLLGCKGRLYCFEKQSLGAVWTAAFALVPLHVLNILVALLCANHVTRTFGKGLMPKRYRLSGADVRADAEKIMGPYAPVRPVRRPELSRASSSDCRGTEKVDPRAIVAGGNSLERASLWTSQLTGLGLDPWARKQI